MSDYDREKKTKFKDVGVGFLMLEWYMFDIFECICMSVLSSNHYTRAGHFSK